MSAPPAPATVLSWLRARDDAALQRLLALRPDLALPAPIDFAALAGRIGVRISVQRAIDSLDQFGLHVLEAMCLISPPRTIEAVDQMLGLPGREAVQRALDRITDLGLAWADESGPRVLATAIEVLGPYPGGIGRPAADLLRAAPDSALRAVARSLIDAGENLPDLSSLTAPGDAAAAIELLLRDPAWVASQVNAMTHAEREIVSRLAAGPPTGQLRGAYTATPQSSTRPSGAGVEDGPSDSPARNLVGKALLIAIDASAVELPREVGLPLRRFQPWGAVVVSAPPIATDEPAAAGGRPVRDVDAAAATEAQTALRLVEDLAARWSANPPTSLRSGGIGVRDLRRIAKDLGASEAMAAMLIEAAAAAGLIGPAGTHGQRWLPTEVFDQWLDETPAARWVQLAGAWLDMARRPGLIGGQGYRERVVAPLSPDVSRATVAGSRRQTLTVLGEAAPGAPVSDVDSVLARLTWAAPRRSEEMQGLAREVLHEAAALGLTGAGGLASFARALLTDTPAAAAALLSSALPSPVDYFLVQPDLTAVVPGPPETALGAALRLIADLESSGGASVYRITEATIRRALDAGQTGAQLHEFFARRSRTPVPQALGYLIDDLSKRHGALRAGDAASYLRCDDPAMLDRVMAQRSSDVLDLRRLAPTVVVTSSAISAVLDALRADGFSPMPEGPDGLILSAANSPERAVDRRRRADAIVAMRRVSPDELAAIVARLRAGDRILAGPPATPAGVPAVPGVTSARTLEVLREAIRGARSVGLAIAESEGTIVARMLEPISLGGGQVRGYDPRWPDRLVSYPLHRITAVLDMGPSEAAASAPFASNELDSVAELEALTEMADRAEHVRRARSADDDSDDVDAAADAGSPFDGEYIANWENAPRD